MFAVRTCIVYLLYVDPFTTINFCYVATTGKVCSAYSLPIVCTTTSTAAATVDSANGYLESQPWILPRSYFESSNCKSNESVAFGGISGGDPRLP
jgi:hypothetical protein